MVLLDSYSFFKVPFYNKIKKSETHAQGVDFPATVMYQQSFVVVPLGSHRFLSCHFYNKIKISEYDVQGSRFPLRFYISTVS